jgi:hypothetical protein
MRTLAGTYRFAETPTVYPDGISSNFIFEGAESARHAWRCLNLSAHVAYMGDVVRRTIREDMVEESRYLRSHGQARSAIKEIVEMPDPQIDRVIRSVQNNQGELSGALRKELPILEEPGLWESVVQAVRRSFEVGPQTYAADKYDGGLRPSP